MPFTFGAVVATLVAVVFAAVVSMLAARVGRARGGVAPRWGAATVGVAYLIGHLGVAPPAFPPGDVTDRLPGLAIVAAVVAVVLGGSCDRLKWRLPVMVMMGTTAWFAMLGPVLGGGGVTSESLTWLVGSAAVVVLASANLGWLDAPGRRVELWGALIALSLGSAVVLLLSNSAVLFQLGGVLGVVLAASVLGAWGRPLGGGVAVAVALLAGLLVEGYVYAFVPAWAALVLAAAPGVLWLTRIGGFGRIGTAGRVVVAVALVLVPIGAAIGLAWAAMPSDPYGYP